MTVRCPKCGREVQAVTHGKFGPIMPHIPFHYDPRHDDSERFRGCAAKGQAVSHEGERP